LTLLGIDTVQIRDSLDTPFIGFAGGDLLVQGNQQVDIVALSHPDSGLYSYGDMVLRSANPVGGDAHYWSGGGFRVETLDREVGDLFSLVDPIIHVSGDLFVNNYIGNSLHILAGSSVTIPGTIIILDSDIPKNALSEKVTLSNGDNIEINGSERATLDIRAGVTPKFFQSLNEFEQIGAGNFPGGGQFSPTPTSAGIVLGSIIIQPPEGQVFISNNYNPNDLPVELILNSSLSLSDILITGEGITRLGATNDPQGIDARGFNGRGSEIIIDARNNILLPRDAAIDSSSNLENSGSINLIARQDILLRSFSSINAISQNSRGGDINLNAGGNISLGNFSGILTGSGGNLEIQSERLLMENFSQIISAVDGVASGGNVVINAVEEIIVNGGNIATFDATSIVNRDASNVVRKTGDIVISTTNLEIVGASLFVGPPVPGNFLTGGDISSEVSGNAIAGDIAITAENIRISNGAQIRASTFGTGDAGDIRVRASNLEISGVDLEAGFRSGIATNVTASSTGGNGGIIHIISDDLELTDGAQISASTSGIGDAGAVILDIADSTVFDGINTLDTRQPSGIFSSVQHRGEGKGGNIQISTTNLLLSNGATLSAQSLGFGDAGSILVNVLETLQSNNGNIATDTDFTSGGQINVTAGNVVLRNDGDIQTFVESGTGGGGNITIAADFVIALEDSDILAFSPDGRGGNIDLSQTTFFGQNANIASGNLSREELLALDGNDRVDVNATGGVESGQITIDDTSFIENSLTGFEDAIIDTAALTSGSCIARTPEEQGSFIITGRDGLPQGPDSLAISTYPTGTVRNVAPEGTEGASASAMPSTGGMLQEPDGVYQLPDGRLVLSRECQ
jgi:hypothetical protein